MPDVRLIDANAMKEDLKNMLARVMYESDLDFDHSHAKIWTATITGIQHSIKRLDNAPTIDAVPVVHGRWVETGKVFVHSMYDLFTKCSKCSFGHVRNEYQEPYRYCPNCGAKMDAEEGLA